MFVDGIFMDMGRRREDRIGCTPPYSVLNLMVEVRILISKDFFLDLLR